MVELRVGVMREAQIPSIVVLIFFTVQGFTAISSLGLALHSPLLTAISLVLASNRESKLSCLISAKVTLPC
jgi:hypothetical protein